MTTNTTTTTMTKMMKAAIVHAPGGPEVLQIQSIPIPTPLKGQVLIQIKAFGLNRSEMFTRQGHSPGVSFPRVLGIEAVGVVEEAPGGEFEKGVVVATAMGGIGRDFDGGYAEFTCAPVGQVQVLGETGLGWEVLGAMPEMLQTAYGSVFKALRLKKGERLLIRGGTTSIGLAAAGLAKAHGAFVVGTSRKSSGGDAMRAAGVDEVIVDDGKVADKLKGEEDKFDKVLELIGTKTLHDSLRCCKEGGIVCQTGIVGDSWLLKEMNPMEFIPSAVCLTAYSGGSEDFMKTPLMEMAKLIEDGKMKLPIGKVFKLDEIVGAHCCMEENKANGKIVVVV